MNRRPSIRDVGLWLRRHSFAWVSSLLLHVLIFLLVLWWGVVALVPGQGAVEVWLVGGLPGEGGASGPEAGREATSRSGEAPRVHSASAVRPPEGLHSSGASARPQVRARVSPRAPQPKDVTKPEQPVATESEQRDTAMEEPTPAAASPSSVVAPPRPAKVELQRPPPVASLLAKALPTVVPRIPFQGVAIAGGNSAIVSREADGPNQVGVGSGSDAAGPDGKKGEEDLSQGSERPQSGVEGGTGSGSDDGRGDGQGVRGMGGGGSWIGSGGGAGKGGGGDWRSLLLRRIEEAKRYPARARRLGMEGVAEVQFRITPDGTVEGVSVVKSSGFPLLDQESLETIKRAAPFPPIPGIVRIPISYRLRDTR